VRIVIKIKKKRKYFQKLSIDSGGRFLLLSMNVFIDIEKCNSRFSTKTGIEEYKVKNEQISDIEKYKIGW
jgi:hypothetical protein